MVGIAESRRRQQTSTFRLVRPGRIVISPWCRYAPCFPWRNTCAQGSPPWERGSMRHRATQLILPFEPALPGRQLILAPRLWPAMTPDTADARDLIGGITINMLVNLESPVTTAHRAKLAYIYVRQSTAGQVRQHQESTELQYRLVDRAALVGWPQERIWGIEDDPGEVGA